MKKKPVHFKATKPVKIVTEKKDEDAEEDIQVTTRALTRTRAQRRRKTR